jgi:adenine phosphoribosyltransferase
MAARKGMTVMRSKPVPARLQPTPRGVESKKNPVIKGRPRLDELAVPAEFDALAYVRALIRDVPDFPEPGVLFRDITPLLGDPRGFHIVLDSIAHRFVGSQVDAVVGVESRGFIFGGALAARLNCSFVPVRRPGKLPFRTDKVSYSLEYGEAELEMHRDSLKEGASVLVVDDLLATGSTAAAAGELVHRQGAYVMAYAFVLELTSLGGRERLLPVPTLAIVRCD